MCKYKRILCVFANLSYYFLKIWDNFFIHWTFSFSHKIKTLYTHTLSAFLLGACAPSCEVICQNWLQNFLHSFCASWKHPLLCCPFHIINCKNSIYLWKTYEIPQLKTNLHRSAKCKYNLFWKAEEKHSMPLKGNLKFCNIMFLFGLPFLDQGLCSFTLHMHYFNHHCHHHSPSLMYYVHYIIYTFT